MSPNFRVKISILNLDISNVGTFKIADKCLISQVTLYGGRRSYQYNEDDFLFKVELLTRFFRIKSLHVIKEKLFKLTASLCFHVFVYSCCLKA